MSATNLVHNDYAESIPRRADALLHEQVRLHPLRSMMLAALAGLFVTKLLRRG